MRDRQRRARPDRVGAREEAFGVAPGARVLPLRVSRSVIHFDFGNVGRAILYAIDQQVDVISMSLGGPGYSGFVREAIGKALDDGIIVVAAAGNYLPATAFPAAFPEVIGVAATHAADGLWRFSAIGRLVDIAAPGEDVWRAHAASDAPAADVTMSTGTSYATACVAGVAALWLSYHGGRKAIGDHYDDRKLVPFAFQYLLGKTANRVRISSARGIMAQGSWMRRRSCAPAPAPDEVASFKSEVVGQRVNPLTFFAGLLTGGRALTDITPEAAGGNGLTPEQPAGGEGSIAGGRPSPEYLAQTAQLDAFFDAMAPDLIEEASPLIAADRTLLIGLHRWRQGESRLPLLDRLLSRRRLCCRRGRCAGTCPGTRALCDVAQGPDESAQQRAATRWRSSTKARLVPAPRRCHPRPPLLTLPRRQSSRRRRCSGDCVPIRSIPAWAPCWTRRPSTR